ncbi:2OG-Fe dioxygenase family protein [Moritella viscosa]
MNGSFLIEAFQAPSTCAQNLGDFFNNLGADPYLESNCRFRAFSQYQKTETQFEKLDTSTFMQSSDVNRLIGNVERKFEDISSALDQHPDFQNLLNVDTTKQPIGVHQIRVVCSQDQSGSPAPEGIHQDGFDFVGIFCVKRDNIAGAFTQIFSSPVDQHPHMSTTLEENQFIIFNDRRYYHYVTETLPDQQDATGLRDVFVFTA